MVIRMTITKSLIAKFLHKRILYINNKLSGCVGYSPAEKKIRIEELQGLLKIVENTPEVKSEFVAEVNISELLKVCRQNEAQYDAVVKQNRQLQTQMNAYKKELNDIKTQIENDCEACKEEYGEDCNCDECLLYDIREGCKGVLCQANGVQTAK